MGGGDVELHFSGEGVSSYKLSEGGGGGGELPGRHAGIVHVPADQSRQVAGLQFGQLLLRKSEKENKKVCIKRT